ncbi:MAG TPA: S41 family peptidase, partial [Longimicrobiales bacterium]
VFHPSRGKPLAPEALVYVDSVFALMEEHALAEGPVDWPELHRETLYRAGGARTPADAHKALQWALQRVNPHSTLLLPDKWAELERRWREKPNYPTGRMLGGGIAYIALPAFASQMDELILQYALEGQHLLRTFRDSGACGWIIDLRRNSGGNMYPMLVAIGPLIGEGNAGFFRAGEGLIKPWGYAGGMAWLGSDTLVRLPRGRTPVPPIVAPVAILTGPLTASSAEAIVAAFSGLDRAWSFGSATAGFSTGNTGYRLTDGATVMLTELVLGDRTGREYGDRIRPDHTVGGAIWNMFADPEDPLTTTAAAMWLRHTDACRARGKTASKGAPPRPSP